MTTVYETLTIEKKGDFALLTLNRPDKLNALNSTVLSELKAVFEAWGKDAQGLKGVVFTGAGDKAFIAGADIAQMSDMSVDQAREFGSLGQSVTLAIENTPFPVIAAVNGFALGGGCEMAMACDFIYATNSAVFGQPEVKLGLIPGFGGTQRLAKLIGRARAKEIIYTGRNVKADEAYRVGLVVSLFENKDELLAASFKTLDYVAKVSPNAVKLSKQVMNAGNDLTVEAGLQTELAQFSAVFSSEDMKEGCKAFVEKRPAQFKGC
tara:strand:- start:1111 stop:1905 length:795 start_codon:yes stop_codon:yes gene_type:complete